MATVFAFAETRGGDVRKVGLEAVTAARTLADKTGGGAAGGDVRSRECRKPVCHST